MQRLEISNHAFECHVLDETGRYGEAIECYAAKNKQVVYVDEYQPSSAKITLGDPIYRGSSETESLRIGRIAAPSPIGILIVLGIIYLLTR